MSDFETPAPPVPTDSVGYGKPPKTAQFRRGVSGNPKGRPKKERPPPPSFGDKTISQVIEQEAFRSLSIREDGKVSEIITIEALLRSMLQLAISGKNRIAQRQLLELLREEEARTLEAKENTYRFWVDYKQKAETEIARCKATSQPRPAFLPHPADILVDVDNREIHFLGPIDRDELPKYDRIRLTRDLAMASAFLLARQSGLTIPDSSDPLLMSAHYMQDFIPPSYCTSGDNWVSRMMHWQYRTSRELRQDITELQAEIDALPPADVKAFMKERVGRLDRSAKAASAIGELLALTFEALLPGNTTAGQDPDVLVANIVTEFRCRQRQRS